MNELDDIRISISETDEELAKLFEKRMNLAEQVIDYKVRHGLSILDSDQEARVISKSINNVSDPLLKEYYILFLKRVMEISRAYQLRKMNCMSVSYSDLCGSFAFDAAGKIFPNAKYVSYPNFESAYLSCERGETDVTILPFENAFIHDSTDVIDLIFSGSLFVNMMLDFTMSNYMFVLPGAKINQISKVLLDHRIKSECIDYFDSHAFEIDIIEDIYESAMNLLKNGDSSVGLISPDNSLASKGLEKLGTTIIPSDSNIRFAIFSRILNVPSEQRNLNEHFILVFTVRNQAGALAKALNIIGSHGFNMSNLQSRPLKTLPWNYFFYVELEGYLGTQEKEDLFRQLNTVCDKLKLVGCYKRVKI